MNCSLPDALCLFFLSASVFHCAGLSSVSYAFQYISCHMVIVLLFPLYGATSLPLCNMNVFFTLLQASLVTVSTMPVEFMI